MPEGDFHPFVQFYKTSCACRRTDRRRPAGLCRRDGGGPGPEACYARHLKLGSPGEPAIP